MKRKYKYGGRLPKYQEGGIDLSRTNNQNTVLERRPGLAKFVSGFTGFAQGATNALGLPDMSFGTYDKFKESPYYSNTAGSIGETTGAVAGKVGGMAINALTGGLGNIGQGGGMSMEATPSSDIGRATATYKYGGQMLTNKESKYKQPLLRYFGKKHKNGGININSSMLPDNRNASAEVEGGETSFKNYIFSDYLKLK